MTTPTISLIITTYNWPTALQLVLASVLKQSQLPNEVIIADDGSGQPTRDLITQFQQHFPRPLIHSWQEDNGFRAARSRNLAIAKARSDYLIMIDGDMVLHHHFIRDHQRMASPNQFVQGRRVILTEHLSHLAITEHRLNFSFWSSQVKNKFNALCWPWLSPLISKLFSKQNYRSVRSCNIAAWRSDLIAINGFNEAFIGWGREDSEFVVRLLNHGIKRKDLRLGGVAYHLYHHENTRHNLEHNDQLLDTTINQQLSSCQQGLDQHLIHLPPTNN